MHFALRLPLVLFLAAPAPSQDSLDDYRLKTPRELILEVGKLNGEQFDPTTLVRATNALLRMKKRDADQVLTELAVEFERASPSEGFANSDRLYLVTMLYYDLAGAKKPIPSPGCGLGNSTWDERQKNATLPLLVVNDLPLLLSAYAEVPGAPASMVEHLGWCQQRAEPRHAVLVPGAPSAIVEKLESETRWRFSPESRERDRKAAQRMMAAQVLRATRSGPLHPADDVWGALRQMVRDASNRWDVHRERYVR